MAQWITCRTFILEVWGSSPLEKNFVRRMSFIACLYDGRILRAKVGKIFVYWMMNGKVFHELSIMLNYTTGSFHALDFRLYST